MRQPWRARISAAYIGVIIYRSLGSREIPPYHEVSDLLRQTIHHMKLQLQPVARD